MKRFLNYEKIFNFIVRIFGLKIENTIINKPNDVEKWVYSDKQDYVHKIYVTNYNNKSKTGSFGLWVTDETLVGAYKKAITKTIPCLKWSFKIKIKKIFI